MNFLTPVVKKNDRLREIFYYWGHLVLNPGLHDPALPWWGFLTWSFLMISGSYGQQAWLWSQKDWGRIIEDLVRYWLFQDSHGYRKADKLWLIIKFELVKCDYGHEMIETATLSDPRAHQLTHKKESSDRCGRYKFNFNFCSIFQFLYYF